MQPKKKKHGAPASRRKFVALWTGGTLLAWLVVGGLGLLLPPTLFQRIGTLLLGIFLASALGWTQQQIVQRYLHVDMQGWLRASLFGGLATGIALMIYVNAALNPLLTTFPLLIPLAMVQWFWLRTRVPNAWLWVAISLLNALLFALSARVETLFGRSDLVSIVVFMTMLLDSGFVMHYLWTHSALRPLDAFQTADDAALIERLSTRVTSAAPLTDAAQWQHKRG